MRAPAATVRPMIWLVEARVQKITGACWNSGITPPTTIWRPITPATAANSPLIARWPRGSSAPAMQAVHERKEGEVAAALGELGEEGIGAEQGEEDRPHRHRREGGDQRPVAGIAAPVPQLEDRERAVERRGEEMAPQGDERGHRAPSGQITTRAVWSRIRRSRKGV